MPCRRRQQPDERRIVETFEQLPHCDAKDRVAKIWIKFAEWSQNKTPLMQPRMGKCKIGLFYDL